MIENKGVIPALLSICFDLRIYTNLHIFSFLKSNTLLLRSSKIKLQAPVNSLKTLPVLLLMFILAGFQVVQAQFKQSDNAITENTGWTGDFGLGTDGRINVLAEGPDGQLFVGGRFEHAGALEAENIALWTGEEWQNIGDLNGTVSALYRNGNTLYVGGSFTEITTTSGTTFTALRIARYNIESGTWSAMGAGFAGGSPLGISTLEMNNSGTLYAGGCFNRSGDETFNGIATWNGNEWVPFTVGTEDHEYTGLWGGCVSAIYYDEVSNSLYVGGSFRNARIFDSEYESFDGYRDTPVGGIVRWSGGNWHMVGGGTWRRAGAVTNVSTGVISTIARHPDSGRLYIGGSFDHLIEEELIDMSDIDQNNAMHATSFAYRENGAWHGFETTSLSTQKNPFATSRATLSNMFVDGERIFVFGNVVTLGTQNQGSFVAGGVAVFNDTDMEFELDSEGNSILGNGAWHRSARTVPGSRTTRVGLKMGDDIFIAGEFNAFHRGTTTGTLLDMDNITRWDGETYHQLGFGIDGGRISALTMADGLLYLGVAGDFRRAYVGSKTYDASLVIAYDPEARDFVPLQGGISRGGVSGEMIHVIQEDPDNGDIYFGGNFLYGINEDGLTEATRSLIRWDGSRWHEVVNLSGGTAMWSPMVNDLHITNGQLYIAGYFSTIPERADHQRNLMQLDLSSGQSVPIDFPEEWALRDRNFISLESDDEHLYFTANIHSVNDYETGTLFRKNLESGAVEQLNGRLRGNSANSSHEVMMRDGELLYIAGNFRDFRQWEGDGQLVERDFPPNVIIVHPETDTWFYPPESVIPPGSTIRDIYKSGNTIYYANQASDEDRGIRLDIGTGQAHRVGDGFESNPYAFARIGDDLWVGGAFSQRLARTAIVGSAPSPVAMAQLSTANAYTRTGEQETMHLNVANLGDVDLEWNVSVSYTDEHGFGLPDGLVVPGSPNGSVEPVTVGVIPLHLEGGSTATGIYRVEIEVTTNGAEESFQLEMDVTVNHLFAALDPDPAADTVDVAVNSPLQWTVDEHADEITVYFGTNPDPGSDEIIYQGTPVAALDTTYYNGPMDWHTEYFWMVTKTNEISESQSPVWSFRTMDNPGHGSWALVENEAFSGNFEKTHFTSPQTGWILSRTQIFQTRDGGESFYEVVPGDVEVEFESQKQFQDIFFLDDQTGWIISRYEGIFRTDDGGESWSRIADGTDHLINSVWFHGPDSGWIAGRRGEIRRTGDGGQTWDELDSGTDNTLREIRFADAQTGWVAGNDGTILRTTDGGDSWEEQNSGTDRNLMGLTVHDTQTAWAAGEDEIILFTEDGGTTWSTRHLAEEISFRTPDLESIFAIDQDTVWAVGGRSHQFSLTMYSTDGGETWARVPAPTESPVLDAHFTSAQSGWAVGSNGTLLKYTGPDAGPDTPVTVHPDEPAELVKDLELDQNFPNPFNPTTRIRFSLPDQSNVRLDVFNMLGQRVAVLVNEGKSAGSHTVSFDASGLSSGVYIYRLQTDSQTLTRQMLLIK